jgi:hypothetical protein
MLMWAMTGRPKASLWQTVDAPGAARGLGRKVTYTRRSPSADVEREEVGSSEERGIGIAGQRGVGTAGRAGPPPAGGVALGGAGMAMSSSGLNSWGCGRATWMQLAGFDVAIC